jgi:hypothetical protein
LFPVFTFFIGSCFGVAFRLILFRGEFLAPVVRISCHLVEG